MRRNEKEVKDQRVIDELLMGANVCRLAMVDDGEPYVIPVNFGYSGGALYIHSAPAGRKMDVLRRNPRVCFEIESSVTIMRHIEPCHWGARARSVVGYGRAEIVTADKEKRRGLDIIMAQCGKTDPSDYDEKHLARMIILRIPIESLSCKQLGHWKVELPSQTPEPTPLAVMPPAGQEGAPARGRGSS